MQTTGNIHEQECQSRLCQKTSNKPSKLLQPEINLYQNDVKRKSLEKEMNSWWSKAAHPGPNMAEAVLWDVWLPMERPHCCLLVMWLQTHGSGWILRRIELCSLLPERCCVTLRMDNDSKHAGKATQDFLKAKKGEYSPKADSVTWSQPPGADFQLLRTKLKAENRNWRWL